MRWNDDQLETLRINYANWPTYLVAHVCGHGERATYMKAAELGLKKSATYLASPESGRLHRNDNRGGRSRFKKGQEAWNKGTQFRAGGRSTETQFKPGVVQGRAAEIEQPIGAERITKDGLLQRKVNNDLPFQRRWKAVHAIVWEEANGAIPAGHVVIFKPGRATTDAALIKADGLELVSRGELMRRNSYHNRYPKEVAQLIQLRGALNRKLNRRLQEA